MLFNRVQPHSCAINKIKQITYNSLYFYALSFSFYAHSATMEFIPTTKPASTHSLTTLAHLTRSESLQLITKVNVSKQLIKHRYQQYYQGVPVWNSNLVASFNHQHQLLNISGFLLRDIQSDIQSIKPSLSALQALNIAFEAEKIPHILSPLYTSTDEINRPLITNKKVDLYIYLDTRGKARLVYIVSFMAHTTKPKRPYYIIDAHDKTIIDYWQGLTTRQATGPGGNEKTGIYHYGTDYDYLTVSDDCRMTGPYIDTVDLNHNTTRGKVHQFPCANNTYKAINGAFSPLNDAHFFGTTILTMYEKWFNIIPLQMRLTIQVHYRRYYENAFWDGRNVTFGDGYQSFYPLVSLDVVSHEVAHGFTEQHSNLIYRKQPGGINESYSDIAGEVAEYYLSKKNDWMVGSTITKTTGALRYFADPTLDGRSIDHADDYTWGLDVHFISGVFNKAFYLLATTPGWDIKKAFTPFMLANQIYWRPESQFNEAGCGVVQAAKDLKLNADDVESAFAQVGVNASCQSPNDPIIKIEHKQTVSDLSADKAHALFFQMPVPFGMHNLTFKVWGGSGNVDLYMRHKNKPTRFMWDCRPFKNANDELCQIDQPKAGTYYVMLYGREGFQQVSLQGSYEMRVIDYTNNTTVDIPDRDFEGVNSDIKVGLGNTVIRARITVDITHPDIGDIAISLIPPNGQRFLLKQYMSQEGQRDLKARYEIKLDNLQQGGIWHLNVKDVFSRYTGTLNSWRLELFDDE
ncbi:M4 family metallopeptidase [Zooshikella sp. RANM57]|uniref:M4 family metallopeptidase n=1 Tax=Zooshikella sp. RANM57 TaxID=3425863 RepID=UPI003D6ED2C5